ncbi:MAG: hypothetical protein HZY79_12240 [Rhodoblastus sp.]|nr:MAG: hypothetical protein HZY79_12240 [Rhodoblastus sp.]
MADASRKQPRLAHSAPPEPLARELREVAGAARAFGEAIRGANVLPDAFPKQPTLDIARVLEALPDGTGEGAYEQLVYARNRLSELRRRHIQTEAAAQARAARPPLTRGERIDQTLTRLVADMGTALDAYRALAARDEDERAEVAGAVISDPEEPEVAATARNAGEAQRRWRPPRARSERSSSRPPESATTSPARCWTRPASPEWAVQKPKCAAPCRAGCAASEKSARLPEFDAQDSGSHRYDRRSCEFREAGLERFQEKLFRGRR